MQPHSFSWKRANRTARATSGNCTSPALQTAAGCLSYGDLHRQAVRLARALLVRGLQGRSPVAIWLPRGLGLGAPVSQPGKPLLGSAVSCQETPVGYCEAPGIRLPDSKSLPALQKERAAYGILPAGCVART